MGAVEKKALLEQGEGGPQKKFSAEGKLNYDVTHAGKVAAIRKSMTSHRNCKIQIANKRQIAFCISV